MCGIWYQIVVSDSYYVAQEIRQMKLNIGQLIQNTLLTKIETFINALLFLESSFKIMEVVRV